MTPQTTPIRLNLKKDEKLEIDWQDGVRGVYTISYLRAMCPCAQCKLVREGEKTKTAEAMAARDVVPQKKKRASLTILPGNYAQPLAAVGAELVGNYALRIDWSDSHGSGIYSFQYLREICPK
jgi:DUF971 family protein